MTFKKATSILGVPSDCTVDHALSVWKQLTAYHRRTGNDDQCKLLSQVKQAIKHSVRPTCVECGVRICHGSRCQMHVKRLRYYSNKLKPCVESLP